MSSWIILSRSNSVEVGTKASNHSRIGGRLYREGEKEGGVTGQAQAPLEVR